MRPLWPLCVVVVAAFVASSKEATAHDFERTRVTLTFAADGSFVLDVTNDAAWLEHRLIPFGRGPFFDRIVLFVDGREVRPDSVEYVGPQPRGEQSAIAGAEQSSVAGAIVTYRMRGYMPLDAKTLRWYYGLPIDPYPFTVRRADGRIILEEIAGDAWSGSIDLAGQFRAPRLSTTAAALAIAALLTIPIAIRIVSVRRARPSGRAEPRGTA